MGPLRTARAWRFHPGQSVDILKLSPQQKDEARKKEPLMIPYSNSRRMASMFAGVSVILVVLAGACASRPAGAPAATAQGGSSQPSYETRAYETRAVHDPNGIGKF